MLTPRKKEETQKQKKEKKQNTLFMFINNINYDKKDVLRDNPDLIKEYNTFVINQGLSFLPETVMYANEMNRELVLNPIMHHDYLVHSLRKKKRYAKWIKMEKEEHIEIIQKHYNYSREKAIQALSILTDEQVSDIIKLWDI